MDKPSGCVTPGDISRVGCDIRKCWQWLQPAAGDSAAGRRVHRTTCVERLETLKWWGNLRRNHQEVNIVET